MQSLEQTLPALDRLTSDGPTAQNARAALTCLSDLGDVVRDHEPLTALAVQVGRARYLADSMLDLFGEVTTIDLSSESGLPTGPGDRRDRAIHDLWRDLTADLERIKGVIVDTVAPSDDRDVQIEALTARAERAEANLTALRNSLDAALTQPVPAHFGRRARTGYAEAVAQIREAMHAAQASTESEDAPKTGA